MKNFLVSGIKNPLAPFILLLALIILMTIIISNINTARETAHAGRRSLLFDPQPEETDETAGMSAGSEPDIRRLTAEALDAWEGGDLAAAEDKFRTILVFRPNSAVALSHLGALLHHRGDYASAERMFRRQTLFHPGDPNAYLNLASVLARQNKLPEALAVSKQSLRLAPKASSANLLSLAKIYSQAKDEKRALDYFRRAASILGPRLVEAGWDPAFDNIRKNPEFQTLLRDARKQKGSAQ